MLEERECIWNVQGERRKKGCEQGHYVDSSEI